MSQDPKNNPQGLDGPRELGVPLKDGQLADQTFATRMAGSVAAMARGFANAMDFFGPGLPMNPAAQEVARGRRFDYPVAINISPAVKQEGYDFPTLRALADNYDLLRFVIEKRKDSVCRLAWEWVPKDGKVDSKDEKDGIAFLTDFFEKPDKENVWPTWLRMLLEDLLVIDAVVVYPRPTRGGGIYGFEAIDGASVKKLINPDGRTPLPPDAAYQQIIKGMPATDYTRDEILYISRNLRTHKIYGFSPVEQLIVTVDTALRRQLSQKQSYTEGNIPEGFAILPDDWNSERVREFQGMWDSLTAGVQAEKRRLRFLPGIKELVWTKPEILKDGFDDYLSRLICFCFSLSPTALVGQTNRAVSETLERAGSEEGLQPIIAPLEALMTDLAGKLGYSRLKFSFKLESKLNVTEQATALNILVQGGIKSIDEAREELGLPMIGACHMIQTPAGLFIIGNETDTLAPIRFIAGASQVPEGPDPEAEPKPGKMDPPKLEAPKTEEPKALSAAKADLQKRGRTVRVVPFPGRKARERELAGVYAPFLKAQAKKFSRRAKGALERGKADGVRKADEKDPWADVDFSFLIAPTKKALLTTGTKAGKKALLSLRITDEGVEGGITEQVDERAVAYASERAAELVGMKWNGTEYVENPSAEYAITDSTRQALRDVTTRGIEEGWSVADLEKAILEDPAFSEARAEMIARTELAFAHTNGNFEAWRASGVVSSKRWIISDQHPEQDACDENADAGDIPLEEVFPSGDLFPPEHPNCLCDVVAVVDDSETPTEEEE